MAIKLAGSTIVYAVINMIYDTYYFDLDAISIHLCIVFETNWFLKTFTRVYFYVPLSII